MTATQTIGPKSATKLIEPDFLRELADRMLKKRGSSVASVFIAATPDKNLHWVSLQGRYSQAVTHRSSDARSYPVSIPLATLKPGVKRYSSRASVAIVGFRFMKSAGTWKIWNVEDVQVKENLETHEVTVDFKLLLDGDAVSANTFDYTADLYLGF